MHVRRSPILPLILSAVVAHSAYWTNRILVEIAERLRMNVPSIDKKQDCATARSAAERQPSGIRLEFLDGLRGLAALYVVLHHIHQEVTYNQGDRAFLPLKLLAATKWLALGHYGVAVFIVISGYSLMLPSYVPAPAV